MGNGRSYQNDSHKEVYQNIDHIVRSSYVKSNLFYSRYIIAGDVLL